MPGCPAPPFTLSATAKGYATTEIQVSGKEAEVVLQPGVPLSIRLEGRQVAGINLYPYHADGRPLHRQLSSGANPLMADAQGRAEIRLNPGSYRIKMFAPDQRTLLKTQVVEIGTEIPDELVITRGD